MALLLPRPPCQRSPPPRPPSPRARLAPVRCRRPAEAPGPCSAWDREFVLGPKLRWGPHMLKLCFESLAEAKQSLDVGVPKRSLGTRELRRGNQIKFQAAPA